MRIFRTLSRVVVIGTALSAAACSGTGGSHGSGRSTDAEAAITASLRETAATAAAAGDHMAAASHYDKLYQRLPEDPDIIIGYMESLRRVGALEDALRIGRKEFDAHKDTPRFLTAAAKAEIAAGNSDDALRILDAAALKAPRDWEIPSLMGVAHDARNRHAEAQAAYDRALTLAPDQPIALNNKALSLAQMGRIEEAIQLLREHLAKVRGGDPHLRQNLALLYAFKGDVREYEALARIDLPEDMVKRNLDAFELLRTGVTSSPARPLAKPSAPPAR